MEHDAQNPEIPVSKYNSAIAQLYRLDNLWQMANYHSVAGNLMKWNWVLDTLWRELSGDATKDKIEKFYMFRKYIKSSKTDDRLYLILELKEIFLRRLQNEQGKGTAYRESDEDYMNN